MSEISLRPLVTAPTADLCALQAEVFADYEESAMLAEVLASEARARPADSSREVLSSFGLVAFCGDRLVGWTQGFREGKSTFYMLNSGVAASERRKGIYSQLVGAVLAHAESEGYAKVTSRHTASNSAVLIAKLGLGFQVSGFEYSEVYGPLVQLTYLVSGARRILYQSRARSIRTPR